MKKSTIAAVMIVKNEEVMLPKCYETIKWVDELVIVDTGSNDSTPYLMHGFKHPNKVESIGEYKWKDDFADARNFALTKCTSDWVITIDADEELLTDEKTIRKYVAEADKKKCGGIRISVKSPIKDHIVRYPRIYRREMDKKKARWTSPVHNLIHPPGPIMDVFEITIIFKHSPSHKADPDRALRMLTAAVKKDPYDCRMMYYLVREVVYKEKWLHVTYFGQKYLDIPKEKKPGELADIHLLMAVAYYQFADWDEAMSHVGQAIAINPNFKEAFYCAHDCEVQRGRLDYAMRWEQMAQTANNKDVHFIRDREQMEQNEHYYNHLFSKNRDMSRYEEIYKKIGEIVGNQKVLDIGCGLAEVAKYIKNYKGFDFSDVAVKHAKKQKRNVVKGDLRESKNYKNADIYICTEVLEHIKNPGVVFQHIPSGKEIVYSVPSFNDPAHLATYTPETAQNISNDIRVEGMIIYGWDKSGKKWEKVDTFKDPGIMLVRAQKK